MLPAMAADPTAPTHRSDPHPAAAGEAGRPRASRRDRRRRAGPAARCARSVAAPASSGPTTRPWRPLPGPPATTPTRTSGSTSRARRTSQVETVGRALGIHPLIVEDVLEGNQRAKIETTDGVVHIVLFHLTYDERGGRVGAGHRPRARAICSPPTTGRGSRRASPHLRSGVEPILKHGPDHLLWALADDIVDGYFPFADKLGDAIDERPGRRHRRSRRRRRSSSCSSSSAS